jgi:hypothetical protein
MMSKELIDELLTEAGIQRSKFAPDCAGLLEAAAAALAQAVHSDVEREAARYRWLRDVAPIGIGELASVRDSHTTAEIDAAFDAAMLAAAPKGKP